MCFAPQRRAFFWHQTSKKWSVPVSFSTFWLKNVLRATVACNFAGSQLPKLVLHWGVLSILAYKCASRHSGVHFLDIWTSKSAPTPSVFFAFSLPNVLFATAACNFWTLELQKWLRDCGVLCILTYKCASRHSAVPFFTCLLNSCLRTRRFSEATFRTSETTNHWKNTAIRNVPNISRTCTCFLVTLHARWSSSTRVLIFLRTWHLYSAFQLCILSEVRLLNFLRLWQDSFFT